MKKLSPKLKKWFDRNSRKKLKQLSDNKRKKQTYKRKNGPKQHPQNALLVAPKVFDVFKNPIETLTFFDNVLDKIRNVVENGCLRFDLSLVKEVGIEAIMYLIALIDIKRIETRKIRCKGNYPEDSMAAERFISSGFYKFVITGKKPRKESLEHKIPIRRGKTIDPSMVTEVSEFISEATTITKRMNYKLLIEMLNNCVQHAYNEQIEKNSSVAKEWFVYAEDCSEHLQIIFFDTGIGIPKSIKKNFFEKIRDSFGIYRDGDYIKSAFEGAFRTSTNEEYRGSGLPNIYAGVISADIVDFKVVSGKGICTIDTDGDIRATTVEKALQGTLYSWKVKKAV